MALPVLDLYVFILNNFFASGYSFRYDLLLFAQNMFIYTQILQNFQNLPNIKNVFFHHIRPKRLHKVFI